MRPAVLLVIFSIVSSDMGAVSSVIVSASCVKVSAGTSYEKGSHYAFWRKGAHAGMPECYMAQGRAKVGSHSCNESIFSRRLARQVGGGVAGSMFECLV
jgi:hypothetical protein